eukprot:snap_masked-scaffold_30-processed-gene-2.24-mRNA-1 protein AED:1.00 eAED:1.00 QI:0/-1/0/0/-1/1/1/0/287
MKKENLLILLIGENLFSHVNCKFGSDFDTSVFGVSCKMEIDVCLSEFLLDNDLKVSGERNEAVCESYFNIMDDYLRCFVDFCVVSQVGYGKKFLYGAMYAFRDHLSLPTNLDYKCSYSTPGIDFIPSSEESMEKRVCKPENYLSQAESCIFSEANQLETETQRMDMHGLFEFHEQKLILNETETCMKFENIYEKKASCLVSKCRLSVRNCASNYDGQKSGFQVNAEICGLDDFCDYVGEELAKTTEQRADSNEESFSGRSLVFMLATFALLMLIGAVSMLVLKKKTN